MEKFQKIPDLQWKEREAERNLLKVCAPAAAKLSSCTGLFHLKCTGMNRKELNSYRGNGTWLCFTCCMPQFTDSFFEDSRKWGYVIGGNMATRKTRINEWNEKRSLIAVGFRLPV